MPAQPRPSLTGTTGAAWVIGSEPESRSQRKGVLDRSLTAIEATFKNRQTPVPAKEFEALSPEFIQTHHTQWNAFVKKIGEGRLADTLGIVIEDLKNFAIPALRSLASGEKLTQQWKAGSGWVAS
jgi:hypothetical protein